MREKVNKMWDYMMNNLFCEKTKLFYDYIVPEKRGRFEEYLPAPELIKAQIPNPCSWGTGMEDGIINGSVMLGAAMNAYEAEKNEKYKGLAKCFFEGLKKCASVSNSEGFLARNISPVDGESHYIDSSRDQYTYWIFSAAKYYKSELATEADREFIRKTLCGFAWRARKNVTEQNDWNLLREDGTLGLVVKMWGDIHPHEIMRLPMIYLAAWKIGGEESFKKDYLRFRYEALEKSEEIRFENWLKPFAVNQMQISLRFVYDYDDDMQFKERCLLLIKKLAQYAKETVIENGRKNITKENIEKMNYRAKPWNCTPAWFNGFFAGYAYYCPMQFKSLEKDSPQGAWLIKDIGDAAMIYLNSPDSIYDEAVMDTIEKIISIINFDEHTSDAPCILLESYYEILKLKMEKNI